MRLFYLFIVFFPVLCYSQQFKLSVDKLDDSTKEVIKTAPYQTMQSAGFLGIAYINLNLRKQGDHYYIGYQSEFNTKSKNLEKTFVNKGFKAIFKLENDSLVVVTYNGEQISPLVSYDARRDNWRCNLDFDFEIDKSQLEKLSRSPMAEVTFEDKEDKTVIKPAGTSRKKYFVNYVPLIE